MMKKANKSVTLTMKHLEDPMLLIEYVIQQQLFIYIYSNGRSSFTQKTKVNYIL